MVITARSSQTSAPDSVASWRNTGSCASWLSVRQLSIEILSRR